MIRIRALIKRWAWPLTLPVAVVLWLLEPFIHPRFGRVCPERIGHLAANTEVMLRRRLLGQRSPDETQIFFASGPISNHSLLALYKRLAPIHVNNAGSGLFSFCEPWLKKTRFYLDLPFDSNEYELWNDAPPLLFFTPEEEARGQAGLRRMGIGPNDWFTAFFTRDSAYLREWCPGTDYRYHDYRNTSLKNYTAAAKFVAERGGFAIRMGSAVAEPMPPEMEHPRVIDYAKRFRDDFMDVYIMAKSRFVIASDTGLGHIAVVFGVPSVNTNAPMLDWAAFLEKDIFIPKRYIDASDGRVLSFNEIITRDVTRLLNGHELTRRGIRLQENTGEEILEAVREMHERLEGIWRPAPEDARLQEEYRALFNPKHTCFGFRSRIGADFLRKNAPTLLRQRQPAS